MTAVMMTPSLVTMDWAAYAAVAVVVGALLVPLWSSLVRR